MARVPPQNYCQRYIARVVTTNLSPCSDGQFDVPPKIVGVGVLGPIPGEAFG